MVNDHLSRSCHSGRILICACVLAACATPGGKTPEEAYVRFASAVRAQDGGRLFDSLDQPTRWSWATIQKAHRECYDILMSTLPEGAEREHQLRRFEAGAQAESAKALFAGQLTDAVWSDLRSGLGTVGGVPVMRVSGDLAEAPCAPGATVPLHRGQDGRWGYAGFAAAAEEAKLRALHDLELIRKSAADYEKAAERQAR